MTDKTYSQSEDKSWIAPTVDHAVSGTVSLPGSKSLTNRELVLSALANSPSTLVDALESRDSALMIGSLVSLGTQITRKDNEIVILPATTDMDLNAHIDCGLAGTVMRFVPPMAALFSGSVTFDGDKEARLRPMKTTIDSLRKLGVIVEDEGRGTLPFTITSNGEIAGGEIEIDASASSQFVSGLLLAAPRFTKGVRLRHVGESVPSLPHIEMTIACLRARGVEVNQPEDNFWVVEPSVIHGKEVVIEPDLSNAGPFLAAALVTGGEVRIKNWPIETTQVGKHFVVILKQMGANISFDGQDLTIKGTGVIHGIDIDLSIGGELAPVIIALAALADSPSRITGIAHLRGHETNRLLALSTEINKIGGNAKELEDGIEITPTNNLHGATWETYADHRMATAAAIIGLRVPGIVVSDVSVVSKTMPGFVSMWSTLIGAN